MPSLRASDAAASSDPAALAITMADWKACGAAYAQRMVSLSKALAAALEAAQVPVYRTARGVTESHQFAIEAARYGGGQAVSKRLRRAGFLACGIGLPIAPVAGDMNGLRIGTPELARWGVTEADIPEIAGLVARALASDQPETLAGETAMLRARFDKIHFTTDR